MPLPKNTPSFVQLAKGILSSNGRMVIFIVGTQQIIDKKIIELKSNDFRIEEVRKERSTSPREWRYTIYARKDRKLN
jgi:hypothetical protein